MKDDDKPPSSNNNQKLNLDKDLVSKRKWRDWHEREIPVKIEGQATREGMTIKISSKPLTTELSIAYPNSIWQKYRKENKVKLVDNVSYIFTAHLPFLLKGNIRLDFNTGYPHVYSWANQCFMRYLPAYWYLYHKRRGTSVFPMLKTLLNSNVNFSETEDEPPLFPETIDENLILPFTFGKDSLLTYHLAKELGLKPVLIFFQDPMDEGYEGKHKMALFKKFSKLIKDKTYFVANPLGNLREKGEGWFGWELACTSWALLALPFAYHHKAGYLVYSNEKSVNAFFYDDDGLKVIPDYEQSAQATEELSILTQALSEGEVYTTTFLQGLNDLGIIAILKKRYFDKTFKFLMSCWSEVEEGKNKRWCGNCSKCARLYVYLTANGINPIKEAGFKDNMFHLSKAHLFNVFGQKASGTGWDAFGLNTEEQILAFYLTYLRGNRDPLAKRFVKTPLFKEAKQRFNELVEEYYSLHEEYLSPPQWKKKIDRIFTTTLKEIKKELFDLRKG